VVRRPPIVAILATWLGLVGAAGAGAADLPAADSVTATTCRLVESAARTNRVPVDFLTRLVWTESRFRADATSPKGAQGIAQFMPDTAAARGLADPFDPEQAIPHAAKLLAELTQRFGNIGLAAAAYNAGSVRVAAWLDGGDALPAETQIYVAAITGRSAADWAAARHQAGPPPPAETCLEATAGLRAGEATAEAPVAPWGVQLAGNFSKTIALASFARARARYAGIIGDLRPMVIGGVLRSRGWRPFYRVMLPSASRAEADRLCNAILADGGACVASRS